MHLHPLCIQTHANHAQLKILIRLLLTLKTFTFMNSYFLLYLELILEHMDYRYYQISHYTYQPWEELGKNSFIGVYVNKCCSTLIWSIVQKQIFYMCPLESTKIYLLCNHLIIQQTFFN